MPYKKIGDLPGTVQKNLPVHAQEIFLEAFNSAWDQYADPDRRRGSESREEVAFRVAWAAVEKVYAKNEKTGIWEKRRK
ncbi:MAG TPA: ChaB family protein [Methanoregulaceae archaeon]|nr:ChaB family protein [Methanoregulaceae archaeon]